MLSPTFLAKCLAGTFSPFPSTDTKFPDSTLKANVFPSVASKIPRELPDSEKTLAGLHL